MINRRLFLRQTTVLATMASSWPLTACSPKAPNMNPEEAAYIERLMRQVVPRGVGRYLIDLPESLVINPVSSSEIEGVTIDVGSMSRAVFDARFDAYKSKLAQTKLPGTENPCLRSVTALPNQFIGAIFDRAEDATSSDRMARTLEIWAWKSQYFLTARINAVDTNFPEDAEDSIARQLTTDVPEKLDHLLRVFSRVRGRKDNEVPKEQGDCIANGFVAGPPNDQQAINVSYQLHGSPDLYFNFNHTTTVRERDTLLERTAQVEREMQSSGTQTVRKGKRDINGLPYEEWLMRGPTPNGVSGTMFMLHGNETASDPAKPFVELGLFNGFRVPAPERTLEESAKLKNLEKASLTEALALGLWDRVTATLRPRPGAF